MKRPMKLASSALIASIAIVSVQARADEQVKVFGGVGGEAGGMITTHPLKGTGIGGSLGAGTGGSVRARGGFYLLNATGIWGMGMIAPGVNFAGDAIAALTTPEIEKTCAFDLGAAVNTRGSLQLYYASVNDLTHFSEPAATGEIRFGGRTGIVCRIGHGIADYLSLSGSASTSLIESQPLTLGGNLTVAKGNVIAELNVDYSPLGDEHSLDVSTIFAAKAGRVFVGVDAGVNQRMDKIWDYHVEDSITAATGQVVVGAAF